MADRIDAYAVCPDPFLNAGYFLTRDRIHRFDFQLSNRFADLCAGPDAAAHARKKPTVAPFSVTWEGIARTVVSFHGKHAAASPYVQGGSAIVTLPLELPADVANIDFTPDGALLLVIDRCVRAGVATRVRRCSLRRALADRHTCCCGCGMAWRGRLCTAWRFDIRTDPRRPTLRSQVRTAPHAYACCRAGAHRTATDAACVCLGCRYFGAQTSIVPTELQQPYSTAGAVVGGRVVCLMPRLVKLTASHGLIAVEAADIDAFGFSAVLTAAFATVYTALAASVTATVPVQGVDKSVVSTPARTVHDHLFRVSLFG